MRTLLFLLAALSAPTLLMAQKNETVSASTNAKIDREGEMFVFPDNIKLSKNALNERVELKTRELTGYIKQLSEKNGADEALVEKCMRLFNNNEYALVSVTRRGVPDPVTVPVRTYLKRLNRLNYDKVNITWRNAQYVSNFTKQPDGNYVGLVAFEQAYTGSRNGEAGYTYSDVTQKHVEVTVRVWEATNIPRTAYMEVFLGNIGVTEE